MASDMRKIRVDEELWTSFGEAVQRASRETDRSKVVREFMRWYTGERGAQLPDRPR